MYWLFLILGGLFEVAFTLCLKYSENFTRLWPSLGFFAAITLSFYCLNRAAQGIPIGTAYAVWTGIGAAGTVIVGIMLFGEDVSLKRMFFLFLLVASIAGLKLVGKE